MKDNFQSRSLWYFEFFEISAVTVILGLLVLAIGFTGLEYEFGRY